jgi:hypothetical protein
MKGGIKNIIDNFFSIDETPTNSTNETPTTRRLALERSKHRILQNDSEGSVLDSTNLSSDKGIYRMAIQLY